MGGFNNLGFGEDFDLAARLKAAGYSVVLHTDLPIHDTMYLLREICVSEAEVGRGGTSRGSACCLRAIVQHAAYEQFLLGSGRCSKACSSKAQAVVDNAPAACRRKTVPYAQAIVACELGARMGKA
ncbi:MAG: hypothetical protein U0Z44_07535 [Kouleothrix sp.]